MNFVSSLDEATVESASQMAFASLPGISKAVSELIGLKGVGPVTASAVLAAEVAPFFMSDEAMEAALGSSKDYSLKQYLLFVDKLQTKAKELSSEIDSFTPCDIERALWSSAVRAKLSDSPLQANSGKDSKRKRNR